MHNDKKRAFVGKGTDFEVWKSNRKNTVLKKFREPISFEDFVMLKEAHEKYLHECKKFGLFVPKTNIRGLRKQDGKIFLILEQEMIAGDNLAYLFQSAPKKEVLDLFKLYITQLTKYLKYVYEQKENKMPFVYIDLKPENLILSNGRLINVDTFNSFLLLKGKSKKHHGYNIFWNLGLALIYSERFRNPVIFLKLTFDWGRLYRPELESEFREIAKQVLIKELANRGQKLSKKISAKKMKVHYNFWKLIRLMRGKQKPRK